MFDFDAGKLVVIGAVALVVIGPKELPRVLRQVGQTVSKVRRMAAEFQSQFMDAMREAEMADVKEEMKKIAESAKIDVAFDPVRDIRNQIGGAIAGDTVPHGPSPSPVLAADGEVAKFSGAAPSTAEPATFDLSSLESLPSHADGAGFATASDTGLSPTTPDPDPAGASHAKEADGATLDDVRHALAEELGKPANLRAHGETAA